MVNGSQAVSSVGGGAPLFVRASSAAAVLSAESTGTAEAAPSLRTEQVVAETAQSFRYNSFEFSYRQDFGKIVLIRQKPDTGELVQQFPSEYYLRKYADSQRVAKTAAGEKEVAAPSNDAGQAKPTLVSTPAPSGGTSAPANDAAPAPAPAPALPSAASAGSARVNLTI